MKRGDDCRWRSYSVLRSACFVILHFAGTFALVDPNSVEACQQCCVLAQNDNLFATGSAILANCQDEGCAFALLTTGSERACSSLGLSTDQRSACEVGRDLRFLGVTKLTDGTFRRCSETGSLVPEIVDEQALSDSALDITINECVSCCDALDSGFDQNQPNDFTRANCRTGCSNKQTCFDDAQHRNRLGCALGVEFLLEGFVKLRDDNRVFTCQNGNLVTNSPTASPQTSFPTTQPTRSPQTLSPTQAPVTSSPTGGTSSPSVTNSPTVFPTINDTTNVPDDGDGDSNSGNGNKSLIGSLDDVVLILIVVVAFLSVVCLFGACMIKSSINKLHRESVDNSNVKHNRDGSVVVQLHFPPGSIRADDPILTGLSGGVRDSWFGKKMNTLNKFAKFQSSSFIDDAPPPGRLPPQGMVRKASKTSGLSRNTPAPPGIPNVVGRNHVPPNPPEEYDFTERNIPYAGRSDFGEVDEMDDDELAGEYGVYSSVTADRSQRRQPPPVSPVGASRGSILTTNNYPRRPTATNTGRGAFGLTEEELSGSGVSPRTNKPPKEKRRTTPQLPSEFF